MNFTANSLKVFGLILEVARKVQSDNKISDYDLVSILRSSKKVIYNNSPDKFSKANREIPLRQGSIALLTSGRWHLTSCPFGFVKNSEGYLIGNDQYPIVRRMFHLRTFKRMSLEKIVSHVFMEFKTKLTLSQARYILKSTVYAGAFRCNNVEYSVKVEPCIPRNWMNNTPIKKRSSTFFHSNEFYNQPLCQHVYVSHLGNPLFFRMKKYYRYSYNDQKQFKPLFQADFLNFQFCVFITEHLSKVANSLLERSLKDIHTKLPSYIKSMVREMTSECVLGDYHLEEKLTSGQYFFNLYNTTCLKLILNRLRATKQLEAWTYFETESNFVCFGLGITKLNWFNLDYEAKQELQKIVFPSGVIFHPQSLSFEIVSSKGIFSTN